MTTMFVNYIAVGIGIGQVFRYFRFAFMFVCLFVCLSVCLFVCFFVCLFLCFFGLYFDIFCSNELRHYKVTFFHL